MMENHPGLSNAQIRARYHASATLPTVSETVVAAIREQLIEGKE